MNHLYKYYNFDRFRENEEYQRNKDLARQIQSRNEAYEEDRRENYGDTDERD